MCRYPNLETAKEICRQLKLDYKWEFAGRHIKFYVNGKRLIIGLKKSNPDKVRKDIRRVIC